MESEKGCDDSEAMDNASADPMAHIVTDSKLQENKSEIQSEGKVSAAD